MTQNNLTIKSSVPTGAQYEWKPAVYPQARYFKFENGEWYWWSNLNSRWFKSQNDSHWYLTEFASGYIVPVVYSVNGYSLQIGDDIFAGYFRGKYAGKHQKTESDHWVLFEETGKWAFTESDIRKV